MSMAQTYRNITQHDGGGKWDIHGSIFVTTQECKNDYYPERLPSIPAGTAIVADFAGDFGMYGMVEVDGVLHKVKVDLHELHKIDFGPFDARNNGVAQIAA
jgi:hypothetical protein